MDKYLDIVNLIALAFGTAWASGINLYAVILVIGLLGSTDIMTLPAGLEILQQPVVIWAAGFMYLVEFVADKVPGVDSSWDALHTFIRIPAGAILAAAVFSDVDPAWVMAAALVGGSLAAGSHFAKSSSRLLINLSPEPFSNIGVSIAEDALVLGGLWFAFTHPWIFLVLLVLFVGLLIWALPILLRGVRSLLGLLSRLFRPRPTGRNRLPEA
jgi:hypothetical protein